jgi:hypothetical protein
MHDFAPFFAQNFRKAIDGLDRRFLAKSIYDPLTIRHERTAATIARLNVKLITMSEPGDTEMRDDWFDLKHFSLPNRGRVIPFAI